MSEHLEHENDNSIQLDNYYYKYFKYENVCDNIDELTLQETLDCESRPIITCILVVSIIVLILIKVLSPYIEKWLSSRQLKEDLQDEEVGLLETTAQD